MRRPVVSLCSAILMSICLTPVAQASHEVDCATANEDINRLRHEKVSTGERMLKGATAIMPIGLVVHTVTGTEQKTMEMASGEYNEKIDQRILEIVHECGIK